MTLTEEQRDAIRAISKLPMAIGCQLCHPYIMKNYGSHFIVLRAMIDSSGTVEPTGGFDLEKARAADEALPYPLDAKEIWVSGKGQMHINPPNAPSIFFTLSDLCEFRNLFHGQAAEIARLRAELARVNQLREIEIDQAGASERIYREAARLKDARIKELEDAHKRSGAKYAKIINELRSSVYANIPGLDVGKIGPDAETGNRDHVVGPDQMIPNGEVWQITEERVEALQDAVNRYDVYDRCLVTHDRKVHVLGVLRAMLAEAGQE